MAKGVNGQKIVAHCTERIVVGVGPVLVSTHECVQMQKDAISEAGCTLGGRNKGTCQRAPVQICNSGHNSSPIAPLDNRPSNQQIHHS